jgi:seryl-tRNA synthetase
MIDLKALRDNPEPFKAGLEKKGYNSDHLNDVLALDKKGRDIKQKLDEHRATKNVASDKIAKLEGPEKQKAIDEMQSVSNEEKVLKSELLEIEAGLTPLLHEIPNPAHESVPEGGEEDSVVEKTQGKPTKFKFTPKDHVTLGTELGWLNIEKASEGSGARFAYLMGDAAHLEFALVRYAFAKLSDRGCSVRASSPQTKTKSTK